jgi:glucokinase
MAADNPVVVAVDLGGTYTKLAIVDRGGAIRAQTRLPTKLTAFTDGDCGRGTLEWLADEVSKFARTRTGELSVSWRGFGVVLPGVIDAGTGIVRNAANIGWHDFAITDDLVDRLGMPGRVGHDVRTAGLAEWQLGAGRGSDQLLFVPLGTGIAVAAVVDGHLLEADGYAGELGHAPVPTAGRTPCACGGLGCLETVASAAGVSRSHARLAGLAQLQPAERVAARARTGDGAAGEAFRIAGQALGEALVAASAITGCERVVLGGGLSGAADLLLPTIETVFDQNLTVQRRPRMITSVFGSSAGLVGAGLLAWQAVDAQPWNMQPAGAQR